MKIIISPAKKMNIQNDLFEARGLPRFVEEAAYLQTVLRAKNISELQALWQCNDKLTALNQRRLKEDVYRATTPAILAYEGLQYQHMAPEVLSREGLDYIEAHLRILSGFYGGLRPFDAVVPYRLEMQAKLAVDGAKNLYAYWGGKPYDALKEAGGVIVNLASQEYAKAVTPYLGAGDRFVTCRFGEILNGTFKQKGTFAKMARGEMVRYMAEHHIECLKDLQDFDALGMTYAPEWSDANTMSFIVESTKEE